MYVDMEKIKSFYISITWLSEAVDICINFASKMILYINIAGYSSPYESLFTIPFNQVNEMKTKVCARAHARAPGFHCSLPNCRELMTVINYC